MIDVVAAEATLIHVMNLNEPCEVEVVATLPVQTGTTPILHWSAIRRGLNSLYTLIERALLLHLNCVFFFSCLASERIMILASQMEC